MCPKSLAEPIMKYFLDSESIEIVPVSSVVGVNLKSPQENPYEEFLNLVHSLYEEVGKTPHPKVEKVNLPVVFDEEEFRSFATELKERLDEIDSDMEELRRKIEELSEGIEALEVLRGLDVSVSELRNTRWIRIRVGKVPLEYAQRLQKSFEGEDVLLLPGRVRGGERAMVVIHPKDVKVEGALKNAAFRELKLPDLKESVEDALFELKDERKSLEVKLQELHLEKKEIFYKNRRRIYSYYDTVYVLKAVHDAMKSTGMSKEFVFISGWMTERGLEGFKKLAKDFEGVVVFEEIDIPSQKPTLLRNNRFFKHFEFLVKMYGIPRSDEIDPTPIVAVLFLFFYGLMFGDVGHGAVIAAIAWYLFKKRSSDLWFIMTFAGLSSVFFGLLSGSIFGFETIPPLFERPLENINDLLMLSIYIGAALIVFGMILNIYNRFARKELKEVVFDANGFAGMGLYLTAISAAFLYASGRSVPLELVLYPILAFTGMIFVGIVIFEEGTLGERIILAFFETFDRLLAFFSNTLSFIRLGAFAMNHAGLFLAFYTMAKMSKSAFGSFMSLLLGNLLLIFLEGLVVFIQAVRLEFYEFFSKFYSGDGREFKPLRYEGGAER